MESNSQPTASEPRRRRSPWARIALGVVVAAIVVFVGYRLLDRTVRSVDVVLTPEAIPADGVTSSLLEIRLVSRFGNRLSVAALPAAPKIEITEGAALVRILPLDDSLRYRLVAGFDRGRVVIHVRVPGIPAPFEEILLLTPSLADRNGNGYPDVVDLTSQDDLAAFRKWFVAIALGQLGHLDDQWTDRDCAGLLRYCFREALKQHDNRWLAARRWLVSAAIPDVAKYNYPNVPVLGTRVFNAGSATARADAIARPVGDRGAALEPDAPDEDLRDRDLPGRDGSDGDLRGGDGRGGNLRDGDVGGGDPRGGDRRDGALRAGDSRAGALRAGDSRDGALRAGDPRDGDRGDGDVRLDEFATFAAAARLKDNAMVFVGRDVGDALAGDVLFYLNDTRSAWPYHTMIYVGNGRTVYHTGPDGDHPGIVKQMTLAQLAAHANPRWHPVASNPYFLGFYRWRILS